MSDIITVRDISIVTAEINTIKTQTRRVVLSAALQIGSRLIEAKALLPHGEWGKWLENEVDYSQSTAENLMKLYREYGSNQDSLFDDMSKSQAVGNLTYTQAMALLALPSEERTAFVEGHDMDTITTRDLRQQIKDLLSERDQAKADLEASNESAAKSAASITDLTNRMQDAIHRADSLAAEVDTAREDLIRANLDLDTARKALADAKKNPQIPAATMAKIRADAESAAATKKVKALQKKLEAAAKAAEAAKDQIAALSAQVDAEKAARRMASPEAAVFKQLFEQIQPMFDSLVKNYQEVRQSDPDTASGLHKALEALLAAFQSKIKE